MDTTLPKLHYFSMNVHVHIVDKQSLKYTIKGETASTLTEDENITDDAPKRGSAETSHMHDTLLSPEVLLIWTE